jgi:Zn-dependent peptidase ImmA (M78 family)
MAATASPVTPTVLSWALAEDGRPLNEIAEAAKVTEDDLDAWANGAAAPTRGQVTTLARVLRRPRALFFMPAPPSTASLPPSFRHPPGVARSVSPKVRRAGRDSRRIQQAVAWARREEDPPAVPRVSSSTTSPGDAASTVREWLGVNIDDQRAWKDERAALRTWREVLEQHGVLVFALQLGSGEVRGFSTWDDRAPLVVVNTSSVQPAARIFTLAHELGHLVTRQDATCLDPSDADPLDGIAIERWCEEFAAALLMPDELVDRVAAEAGIAPRSATLETVKLLQRRARVSGRAAALRLITRGWAAPTLYALVVRTFVPKPASSSGQPVSPPRHEARLRAYGPNVIRTVLDALPTRDALSVLQLEVPDARRLADALPELRVP